MLLSFSLKKLKCRKPLSAEDPFLKHFAEFQFGTSSHRNPVSILSSGR